MTQHGINFELLKDAYQIIGGIPQHAFNLDDVLTKSGESLACGTIACAAGWLAMHPHFEAFGLKMDAAGGLMVKGIYMSYGAAMSEVFNMPWHDASRLFGPSTNGVKGSNHKQEWMDRAHNYLRQHGQLKEQLEGKTA